MLWKISQYIPYECQYPGCPIFSSPEWILDFREREYLHRYPQNQLVPSLIPVQSDALNIFPLD